MLHNFIVLVCYIIIIHYSGTYNSEFYSFDGKTANGKAVIMSMKVFSLTTKNMHTVVGCGPLSAPANGTVNILNGTIFGSLALLGCNTGFILRNQQLKVTVMCGADGMWSSQHVTCLLGEM